MWTETLIICQFVCFCLCQCSELGDIQISLSYSPSLQRLSVVVLRARGLQLLTDAGMQMYLICICGVTFRAWVLCHLCISQVCVFRWAYRYTLRRWRSSVAVWWKVRATHISATGWPLNSGRSTWTRPVWGLSCSSHRTSAQVKDSSLSGLNYLFVWHKLISQVIFLSPRASSPTGSAGVGSLHVRQRPAAAALDGHGQHTTGAGQTVAQTLQGHLTPQSWCTYTQSLK